MNLSHCEIGWYAHIESSIRYASLVNNGHSYSNSTIHPKTKNLRQMCINLITYAFIVGPIVGSYYSKVDIHASTLLLVYYHSAVWFCIPIFIYCFLYRFVYPNSLFLSIYHFEQFSKLFFSGSLIRNVQYILYGMSIDSKSIIHCSTYDFPLLHVRNTLIDKYAHMNGHLYKNNKVVFAPLMIENTQCYGPCLLSSVTNQEKSKCFKPFHV